MGLGPVEEKWAKVRPMKYSRDSTWGLIKETSILLMLQHNVVNNKKHDLQHSYTRNSSWGCVKWTLETLSYIPLWRLCWCRAHFRQSAKPFSSLSCQVLGRRWDPIHALYLEGNVEFLKFESVLDLFVWTCIFATIRSSIALKAKSSFHSFTSPLLVKALQNVFINSIIIVLP